MRKVIWIRAFQEFAIPTTKLEIFASSTVVASTRKGPHIMQGPKNRLVQSSQGGNVFYGQKAKIHPMQMHNVRLLYEWMLRNVTPENTRVK
jgi:hypothetical protein